MNLQKLQKHYTSPRIPIHESPIQTRSEIYITRTVADRRHPSEVIVVTIEYPIAVYESAFGEVI